MSADREKIAVVDQYSNLYVYNLMTQQLMYQEPNVTQVQWNVEMDDMIAYLGDGQLFIKTGDLQATSQRMLGEIVGFKGSKIFILQSGTINSIDVPQSSTFYRYLEKKSYDMCYKIACLGVTELDWRCLGTEAMKSFNFDMARKAFIRIRDLKYIELVDKTENQYQRKQVNAK